MWKGFREPPYCSHLGEGIRTIWLETPGPRDDVHGSVAWGPDGALRMRLSPLGRAREVRIDAVYVGVERVRRREGVGPIVVTLGARYACGWADYVVAKELFFETSQVYRGLRLAPRLVAVSGPCEEITLDLQPERRIRGYRPKVTVGLVVTTYCPSPEKYCCKG